MQEDRYNRLISAQKIILRKLEAWKSMQTDFNFGGEWYSLCEFQIYRLDIALEVIRYILEMG